MGILLNFSAICLEQNKSKKKKIERRNRRKKGKGILAHPLRPRAQLISPPAQAHQGLVVYLPNDEAARWQPGSTLRRHRDAEMAPRAPVPHLLVTETPGSFSPFPLHARLLSTPLHCLSARTRRTRRSAHPRSRGQRRLGAMGPCPSSSSTSSASPCKFAAFNSDHSRR